MTFQRVMNSYHGGAIFFLTQD